MNTRNFCGIETSEREGDCCQVCGVENAKEKCKDCGRLWSPSLIESRVCIFCIVKEKNRIIDRLIEERNALEDLNIAYQKRFGAMPNDQS